MARILPDREIKPLLGKVIVNAVDECVRSNTYELLLGERVKFDSTGEERELELGHFLEIPPGDFVTVSSAEALNLGPEALVQIGKKINLMGLITPTTTMMREGFLFTTTKVDPGFRGTLNWGIRNSSTKTVRLKRDEKLFKLTLFELAEDEIPDKLYGDDRNDSYQDSQGIMPSARMIPADIPDRLVVRSNRKENRPDQAALGSRVSVQPYRH